MDLRSLLTGIKPDDSQTQEKKALPTGMYTLIIEKVEAKTNVITGSKGINIQLRVFGTKFNNYCLFDYMMIAGNENSLKYSLPKLKRIGEICKSEITDDWIGKKVIARISTDKRDETKNIIWSYSHFDEDMTDHSTPIKSKNNGPVFTPDDLPF
jgi:hypothetical protein